MCMFSDWKSISKQFPYEFDPTISTRIPWNGHKFINADMLVFTKIGNVYIFQNVAGRQDRPASHMQKKMIKNEENGSYDQV